MKLSEMTDDQRRSVLESLAQQEVHFANHDPKEWPSLFANLIPPKKKKISVAIEFYESLTDKQIETRFAIHHWESKAWNIYESLMGFSLTPMGRSIDPKLWAQREIVNIEMLLTEGKKSVDDIKKRFLFSRNPLPI